ncbi:hypothetical protein [Microtetraspora glauca]|uniref:DUF11 domain-containing protein n=1 Tax=Microtetraspora glauca TaxID=1996 RepID=A0ABV3G6I4_MICGL
MGRRVIMVVAGLACLIAAGAPRAALASDQWGGADLGVEISASPRVAQPGQPLVYDVRVHNNGPGDAVLPVLTIRLPRDVKVINVNVAECRAGRGTNEIICRSPGDVLATGSGGVTVTGLVRPAAHGTLRAQAELSSEIVDPHQEDNTAETVTQVAEGADLAVRLAPTARTAVPGEPFTMKATVRNRGPEVVRDAYVFFQPARAHFLSAAGARCQGAAGYVGCALPPIRSGARNLVELMFRVPQRVTRPIGARATVYSRQVGDRRPANNEAVMRVAMATGSGGVTAAGPAGYAAGHTRPAGYPGLAGHAESGGQAGQVGAAGSPGSTGRIGSVGRADRGRGRGHALGRDTRRGAAGGEHHAGGGRQAAEQDESHQRGPYDQRGKPVHSHT